MEYDLQFEWQWVLVKTTLTCESFALPLLLGCTSYLILPSSGFQAVFWFIYYSVGVLQLTSVLAAVIRQLMTAIVYK